MGMATVTAIHMADMDTAAGIPIRTTDITDRPFTSGLGSIGLTDIASIIHTGTTGIITIGTKPSASSSLLNRRVQIPPVYFYFLGEAETPGAELDPALGEVS